MTDADLIAAGAKRIERIGDALLILGDCREIAPKLPRPDAVVSDPPYGQKLNTAVIKTGTRGGSVKGKSNIYPSIIGDDLPFDPTDLCRMADNVLLWGAHKFHARLPDCGRWLFWDKRGGVLPEFTQGCGEMAWHNQAGPVRVCRLIWGGLVMQAGVKADEPVERVHPAQKPAALMEWCLQQAGIKERALVLDPYMGSGSTGVACLRRGVRFTGIEIEPRYFEVACRRIAEAARQPALFHPEPPRKPMQIDLTYPVERMA